MDRTAFMPHTAPVREDAPRLDAQELEQREQVLQAVLMQ